MKTVTVRDLRNHYSTLLKWIEAGEEIAISRRGKVVARLVPESPATSNVVDWKTSAAVRRDRRNEPVLSAKQSAEILAESQG